MTPPPTLASPRARIKTTPARLVTRAKALFRRASTSVTNSLDQTRRSRRASATDVHYDDDDAHTVRATSSTTTLPRRRRSISADAVTDLHRNAAAPHAVGATLWPANSPMREPSVIAAGTAEEEDERGSDGGAEGGLINRVIATNGTASRDLARDPDPNPPNGRASPALAPAADPGLTTTQLAALDSTPRPSPDTLALARAHSTTSSRAASLDSTSSPSASTTALRTSPPASVTTATTIRPGILRTSPSITSKTRRRPSSSPSPTPSADFPSFTYISADDSVLFANDAHTTVSAVDSPLLAPIPPPPGSDLSVTDDMAMPPRAASLRLHPPSSSSSSVDAMHAERAFPTLPRVSAPARVPFPSAYSSSSAHPTASNRTTVTFAVCDPISPPRNPQLVTVPALVPSTVELRTPTPNLGDEDEYAPIRWAGHLPPLPASPDDVAHAAIELGPGSPMSPVSRSPMPPPAAAPVVDNRVDVLTAYYESKLADVARQYLAEVESVRRANVDADRRAMAAEMELEARAWHEQALRASVDRLEAEVAALRSPSVSVAETEGAAALANWLHAVHAVPTTDLATWDRDLQAAARIAPAIAHHLAHLSSHAPAPSLPTVKSPTPPDSPEHAHAQPTDVDDSPMDHVLDWLAHAAAWARLTARHAAWMVRMAAPGAMMGVSPSGDAVAAAGWRVGGEWNVVESGTVVGPHDGRRAGSVF
ncbi:hypothetical protein AMAG_10664 [Allomyces macrogynus ATCC 38327]|uniref:Uncharacterized protein n=1 Tax=Allomyces macrogynus (strain ATCC 38327) TaxID=578462 RepID=A0A0L0SR74_ALLM3|nr:hypothetical protein AMAG_10664 [Allomyces macrogynus ATCC 38327]|eukprot:KNE64996.1 hypothetical protein AMAG_10664 [Allomyces macrogynus ATCC 38327]